MSLIRPRTEILPQFKCLALDELIDTRNPEHLEVLHRRWSNILHLGESLRWRTHDPSVPTTLAEIQAWHDAW